MDGPSRFAPRKPWGALSFEAPAALADELAAGLAAFGLGSQVVDAGAGASLVRVYLDTPERAADTRRFAAALLRGAELDPDSCGLSVEVVADARWLEAYQATLRPFPLASRFTVHPRGRLEGEDGRIPILLVPGRAFGTGEHPTTRLCAEQLEQRVVPGSRWLDIGCGSGILSLVARHCGAGEVLALDNDAEAVEVAGEVLRANEATDVVVTRHGSLEAAGSGGWDGLVCNISASFALERMSQLASLLAADGVLLVSGFVADDLEAIARQAADCGLRECERAESLPWAMLAAEVG